MRVAVAQIFSNCPRYIHRYQRVEPSPYVPDAAGCAPFARWKRLDVVQDVLPPKDQGRAEGAGGTITPEQYFGSVAAGEL